LAELVWKEAACDWCGCYDTELIFEGPDRLMGLAGQFRMVRCRQCGLLRQDPHLAWESLKSYYPPEYSPHVGLVREEQSILRRLDRRYGMWKQLRVIEQFLKSGRLLDVGCGTGVFLEEMQRSGSWQLAGIEPAEEAAAYARKELGIPVSEGRFSDIEYPAATFDVITMWNVLEHLENPISDLKRAHHLLSNNGLLVFAIPSVESWAAKIFGRFWVGWDLPRHLYLFPLPELRPLLGKLGFQIVAVRCISGSYSTLRDSLEFWMRSWAPAHQKTAHLLLNVYRSIFVRIALGLPLWLLDRMKKSSVITVIAKKISV
jgi:SAM-dependent methyltransferase